MYRGYSDNSLTLVVSFSNCCIVVSSTFFSDGSTSAGGSCSAGGATDSGSGLGCVEGDGEGGVVRGREV